MDSTVARALCAGAIMLVLCARGLAQQAPVAQNQGFVPPPRSIADITAILDSEKPDPAKYGRYAALADQQPPAGVSNDALATFYLNRGIAAGQIGRTQQWLTDAKKALELKPPNSSGIGPILVELASASLQVGNFVDSIKYTEQRVLLNTADSTTHATLARRYANTGRLNEAHAELERARSALEGAQADPRLSAISKYTAEAGFAYASCTILKVEGRLTDAERECARDVTFTDQIVKDYDSWAGKHASRETHVWSNVNARLGLAGVIARQGRLAEAESIVRTALLIALHQAGRYSWVTARAVDSLASVVIDEGRPADARRLAEAALDIHLRIGSAPGSRNLIDARLKMGNILVAEGSWREAVAVFDEADKSIGPDDQLGRANFNRDLNRVVAEIKTGRSSQALAEVTKLAEERAKLLGESHPDTLEADGLRAAALAASGRRDQALAAFRAAAPRLVQSLRASDSGESSPLLRDLRLRFILETYIELLAQSKAPTSAAEAFDVADIVRGQAVQRALSASAARSSVRDPALAGLIRREEDARTQIAALFALIASIQTAPADQRDDKVAAGLRAQIDQLRGTRAQMRQEIEKRYPDYANLIDPRPATLEQARAKLLPGEALIAFYSGEAQTFIWAVSATGSVSFAAVPLSAAKLAEEVQALRRALEPDASTLGEIPAFDLQRAHALYAALLAPVEQGWQSARALLVVPHGALGELPLGLLPTAPVKLQPQAGEPPFAAYKRVPWLIRKVSVTQLPSVTALATLRALPAANPSRRAFAGFGDPWFNEAEAREARAQPYGSGPVIASRGGAGKGLHIALRAAPKTESETSAGLANLPRLPETADEVRSIAIALKADPVADVFVGDKANEEAVRAMNLADRRVVMFATHGLVPGDLDGLQEPALALSAPTVAHIQGDGLLTMSKILGLKLDADWVVLSACNTAAGSGAGAEAVSGLGRAFFYAGTRAILVTNWPVETNSARTLTTDLFRRQADQPGLSRAEALRQAELALIDGPGFLVDGKPLFSYAHPIFWAPFVIIGDGGGGQHG